METDVLYEHASLSPQTNDQIYLKEFILLLKTLPELWDPSNINYSNKYKRVHAYSKLLVVYKKIKVNANIDDVRRKINSLRSNFRKELRKISEAKQSDINYQPKSWVYYMLSFLNKDNKTETEPLNESIETFEGEPATLEEQAIPVNTLKYNRYSTSDECETPLNVSPATNKIRKRRRDDNHTTSFSITTDRDDEIFGEYITSVLRSFTSEICKKKLKRVIQRAIVDIQDEEDAMETTYSRTRSSSME